MSSPVLTFSLLGILCFSLTTFLEPWFQGWAGNRAASANLLTVALGDSRRLFAKHFYVKADAYFHSGYYPSIYDTRPPADQSHMAAASHESVGHASGLPAAEDHEEEADFLGNPRDWIESFSRHFFPTTHRHLGEKPERAKHDDSHGQRDAGASESGEEREMLPWLKLSANLDPERPETYIIASYWLRTRLNKVDEAERFLREGLQANPGHYEILLELGNIYKENRKDPERARNLWELALKNWREKQSTNPEANLLSYEQTLGNLAKLEEEQKNYSKAIEYLKTLKDISPNKEAIQKWIEELLVSSK